MPRKSYLGIEHLPVILRAGCVLRGLLFCSRFLVKAIILNEGQNIFQQKLFHKHSTVNSFVYVRSSEGNLLLLDKKLDSAEIFWARFEPLRVRSFKKTSYLLSVLCCLLPTHNRMLMYGKVNARFLQKIAYRFVWMASSSCHNWFWRSFFFNFSPILEFEIVAFVGAYTTKCLCVPYIWAK